MFQQAKFDQASRFYRMAVRRRPKDGRAYLRLGLAQANAGDPGSAIDSLRRALDLLPAGDRRGIAIRVHIADLTLSNLRNSETLDESQATAQEILSRSPMDFDGLRIYGTVMLARSEWLRGRDEALYDRTIQNALQVFESADHVRPGQTMVEVALARTLAVMGRFPEAETRYRSLLQRDLRADALRAELYRVLLLDGKPAEAGEVLLAGAGSATHPEWFSIMLAAHAANTGNRAGLESALQQMRKIGGLERRYCLLAADFELRSGDLNKALDEYKQCPSRDAEATNLRDERILSTLEAIGRSGSAQPLIDAILKRDPRNPTALTSQARRDIDSGKTISALRVLQHVAVEDPSNYQTRLEEARAHLQRQEFEQAIQKAGEALQLRPDFLPALLLTAQIQFKREEYRAAERTVNQMLAVDADNREAQLMNVVLKGGLASAQPGVRVDPRLKQAVAQIASGQFDDVASQVNQVPPRSEADRAAPGGPDPRARFVYLRKTECDSALARNKEMGAKSDDPFVLAKAINGPWTPPEKITPRLSLVQ